MKSLLVAALLWIVTAYPAFATCHANAPPAIAAAHGLTNLVFCDEFTNANSIDVNDTQNPTACSGTTFPTGVCHWFIHNVWPNMAYTSCPAGHHCPNAATLSADYSISNGLLLNPQTVVDKTPIYYPGWMISSCVTASNTAGYNGKAFQGPFYAEVVVNYGARPSGWVESDEYPLVWLEPLEIITPGANSTTETGEFDFFEAPYGKAIYDINTTGGNINITNGYSADLTSHPSPLGEVNLPGTPSVVQWVSNGTVYDQVNHGASIQPTEGPPGGPYNAISGTAVGSFGYLDTNHYCLMASAGSKTGGGTGPNWPVTITRIAMWQSPRFTGSDHSRR